MTQKTGTKTAIARSAMRKQIKQHYANLAAVQKGLDHGVHDHWLVNPGEHDEYLEFCEERRPMTDEERRIAEWTIERLRSQILELGQQLFAAGSVEAGPSHQESVAA